MADTDVLLASLNSGEVSRLALARVDLKKLQVALETSTNMFPHVLGPTQFRPGTQYLGVTPLDQAGKLLEFYFSAEQTALLVLTPGLMQVMINGAYLSRPNVTAAVTNGTFPTNLAGWTNSDEAGAASTWSSAGSVALLGTGTNYAQLDQQIAVAEPNIEHAVRVVISRGPIRVQVGTAMGDNSYVDATLLAEGTYSLTFTPTGNFWIRAGAQQTYSCFLSSVAIEISGEFSIPTPWGANDLDNLFYDQSGDVLFVASGKTVRQYRIERRSSDSHSWGVGAYYADDGPFRIANTSDVTLTPSSTIGHPTLTASRPLFKTGHVGALFRLTHSGQTASSSLSAQNTFTGNIRVAGLSTTTTSNTGIFGVNVSGTLNARIFAINVSGTFVANVILQRSLGAPGSWTDVETYTAPVSKTFDDKLDNQIVYYRLGIKTGGYTSGTAVCELNYSGSIQTGICRVTDIVSNLVANVDVLQQFGAATATSDWAEGKWSAYRGFPTSVALHDGRLFWQRGLDLDGSVSDAFHSFDDTVVGDSGPIGKVLATGGLDGGRWLLSLQRLIAGSAGKETSIRASAFDEPLTPTQFVARDCSTRGSAKLRALKVDAVGIFVERNGKRVFELAYEFQQGDYRSAELTRLKQEMCSAGVRDIAVQRQPDTRVWFVLGDGTCAVLTWEKEDDVSAWVPFVTAGTVERVAVLPGTDEDEVYLIIARTVNGITKRFIERPAKRSECVGGTLNKNLDCHVVYQGVPTSSIPVTHLTNALVAVWADGAARTQAVNGVVETVPVNPFGFLTIPGNPVSNVVAGLPYTGQIKTAKLAYGAEHGTALEMKKRVSRVGLVMADVGWKGIRIGRDFTVNNMKGLSTTYKGRTLSATETLTAWDDVPAAFNGGWDTDSRVCIQVQSPFPVTIMGLALHMETNEIVDEPPPRNAR